MEDKKLLREQGGHNIIMENRERINISGVLDVETFNEESVLLKTNMGFMTIKGYNLHINKLSVDTGELSVEGEIEALNYQEDEGYGSKGGFFARMFK